MMAVMHLAKGILTGFVLFLIFGPSVKAGKILMSSGIDQTHYIFSSKIGRELVRQGHKVTFLLSSSYIHRLNGSDADWFDFQVYNSPYSPKENKQVRDNFAMEALNRTYQGWQGYLSFLTKRLFEQKPKEKEELKPTKQPMTRYLSFECNVLLGDEEVMDSLRNRQFDLMTFDLVNPCMALVAQKLSLRFIVIQAGLLASGVHDRWYDIPVNPAHIPMTMGDYTDTMTFWQRFFNSISFIPTSFVTDRFLLGPFDALKTQHGIRTDLNMRDTMRSAEMWLFNTHFAMDYPRVVPPNVIMVGGLSTDEPKPLNKELEDFFEGSGKNGVVIFSLGSVVEVMDTAMTETIAAAMARLPQRVLWRYPGTPPKKLGRNTKLISWIPQNDVLGHPKTKLFIYHGGPNGLLETMYHGVPVISIPLFGDQKDSATRIRARGMAEIIPLDEFTEDKLHETAVRILSNDSYAKNAKRLSGIMKHNVVPPVKTAAHWIEHALLHGGAYLRPSTGKLSVIQYYLIDVILVSVCIMILLPLIMAWIYWLLCCKVAYSADNEKEKES